MLFENAQIDPAIIPRAESVAFTPVHPHLRWIVLIQWLITWVLLFSIPTVLYFLEGIEQDIFLWILPALGVLSLLHLATALLSVKFKAYAVRDHDVIWKSGWLVQSVKVVPFNRIQHCSVDAGVLQRAFGLKTLRLFTAGSSMADVQVKGLPADTADSLKDFIVAKLRDHAAIL